MRNAMICASVMLAVFLGWPLAFGGGKANLESGKAEARAVAAASAAPAPATQVADATPATAVPAAGTQPESCYKHYQRIVKQCAATDAACRQRASDEWDMCEATGFWPD